MNQNQWSHVLEILKRKMQNKHRRQAAACLAAAAVFGTVYALVMPAVTMTKDYPTLQAEQTVAWSGEDLEVKVTADSGAGESGKTVVLTLEGEGADLSGDYVFDESGVCVVTDDAGREVELHRSIREQKNGKEDLTDYWFILEPGEETSFTLKLTDEVDESRFAETVEAVRQSAEDNKEQAATGSNAEKAAVVTEKKEDAAGTASASDAVKAAAAVTASGSNADVAEANAIAAPEEKILTEKDDSGFVEILDGAVIDDLDHTDDEDDDEEQTEIVAGLKIRAGISEDYEKAVRDAEKNAEKRGDAQVILQWQDAVAKKAAPRLQASVNGASIAVFYGENAGIPEDAYLSVTEFDEGSDKYEEYLAKTKGIISEATESDAEAAEGAEGEMVRDVTQARFFDITIYDADGNEIQPNDKVKVVITYDEALVLEDESDLNVVHFKDEESEMLEAARKEDGGDVEALAFTTDSFSVYGVSVSKKVLGAPLKAANPNTLTATLTDGTNTVDLTSGTGDALNNVDWKAQMTLKVSATFGNGKDKIIEIKIPEQLSYHVNTDGNVVYQVNGLDDTLKEKINPNLQTEDEKKNVTVLGQNMYNGTITLKFHGEGEENNAEAVSFSLPLRTAFGDNYNGQVWDSGTAWFYDSVKTPITVTQSLGGAEKNKVTLDTMTIKNDEGKQFTQSWTAPYKPEARLNEAIPGNETFTVRPIPNGTTYPKRIAVKKYSVTYTVPEHAEFVKFSGINKTGSYSGAEKTETLAGQETPDGYLVPEGKKAYTWTITDKIIPQAQMKVNPVWKFAEPYFHDGDLAEVKVADFHLQYYGRDHEETIDPAKLPSLTYLIRADYEEVFINVKYQDKDRYQNGYESDSTYNLYMGAPGNEFNQERAGGYFLVGNRGTGDSVPKTVTIEYDTKNTGCIGVTQQRLPALGTSTSKYQTSDHFYKTWNSRTGEVSDWISFTLPSDAIVNLKDLGIAGDSGVFIKALKFNITTIPKQSYLRSGNAQDGTSYEFVCKVLSSATVALKNWGEIESKMTIADQQTAPSGGTGEAGGTGSTSDTGTTPAHDPVTGRAYDGLQGKCEIIPTNIDYHASSVKTGTTVRVHRGLHFHAWSVINFQKIDEIYLISPYGEDYTDIKCGTTKTKHIETPKYYRANDYVTPDITEVAATDELKAVYPKAKVYKLDFTKITAPQEVYDARMIGGNVLSTDSLYNTPLSANSQYNHIWLEYTFTPDISDPVKKYEDLYWVKFNEDSQYPLAFINSGHNCVFHADKYNLTGSTTRLLGWLDPITFTPTEGIEVTTAAKQKAEEEEWYRTYDGTPESVLGVYSQVDYKLTVSNKSSLPVDSVSVYWPVPKAGQNWGEDLTPKGAFNFSMSLENALEDVPEGYVVSYAKNVTPDHSYENWDNNTWYSQEEAAGWGAADWNEVNFVRLVWVGTAEHQTIDYGNDGVAVFDLRVDTTSTTPEQMYTLDTWQPYFRRVYTQSTSWVAGKPVSTVLTPGVLGGTVWNDIDRDGMLDDDEPRLENVTVELYDTSTDKEILRVITKTDENGFYLFDGLKDGTSETSGKDICKIVVYNPTDPVAPGAFNAFTKLDATTDMKATAEADNKSAYIADLSPNTTHRSRQGLFGLRSTTVPAGTPDGNLIYHVGLVKRQFPLTVTKVREEDGEQLPGATFTLTWKNPDDTSAGFTDYNVATTSDALKDVTDNGSGDFWLYSGEYKLTETEAPYKYEKIEGDIGFTVANDGTVTMNDREKAGWLSNGELVITNKLIKYRVLLKKVDNVTEATLSNAEFDFYAGDDNNGKGEKLMHVVISDKEEPADLGELTVGTYYLTETKAPSGYDTYDGDGVIVVAPEGVTIRQGTSQGSSEKIGEDDSKTYLVAFWNSPGHRLPNTGGEGTVPYTLGGLLLVTTALLYGLRRRRSQL